MDSPCDGDRHYIASQGGSSLAGAVVRELQMLCVKLPLNMPVPVVTFLVTTLSLETCLETSRLATS
ncbi:TPA: hypothetical protein ACQJIH_004533 [Citrobacter freundii]|nr:hypothetical protein [Citrobacter freundii]